mgnify:CR=1 FL=1
MIRKTIKELWLRYPLPCFIVAFFGVAYAAFGLMMLAIGGSWLLIWKPLTLGSTDDPRDGNGLLFIGTFFVVIGLVGMVIDWARRRVAKAGL